MNSFKVVVLTALVLAVGAVPATAVNSHGAGHANGHASDNGSHGSNNGSNGSKRNAYGRACADLSKKHVKGEKGTPFSQCVKAMAQLDKHEGVSPKEACADLSKKHVKGEKGTPFSQCVKAAAKLDD
jgi:hypothetical protein